MPPQSKAAPDFIPDNSPDFIPDSPTPTPDASISAPHGIKDWLNSAENDVRYGGDATLPGKILKSLGAKGLNRGVSEGAANTPFITGPILGPIHTAKGVSNIPQHPLAGSLQAAGGLLETAGPFLGMGAPEASEAPQIAKGIIGDIAEGGNTLRNATARMTRYPASAAQSEIGRAGAIKIPPGIRKYVPDMIVPKGEIGTITHPGPFSKIPMRVPKGIPMAGTPEAEQAASGSIMPRPLRPTVGTPEEWQVYEDQMGRLKSEASDAGTYSAARGKVGKKLNYQERIGKRIID